VKTQGMTLTFNGDRGGVTIDALPRAAKVSWVGDMT
jgi:hypothetical protein